MGAFEEIGAAEAEAELAVARELGKQGSLSHRGAAAATIYLFIEALRLGTAKPHIGRRVETGELVALIPNQTNFAASMTTATRPITKGDRLEYPLSSTRYFYVQQEEDIEQLANGYIYRVRFTEHKTKDLGVSA